MDPRGPMPPNEKISLLLQQVSAQEDDKKVLAARLEQFSVQLEEKERALAQANREIKAATAQIVSARNDLQNWKKDAIALRDKMGSMEKENRETLEAIIKTLEKTLSDKEGARSGEPAPLELLPLPRQQ
jgi:chromosome segregation ATPase